MQPIKWFNAININIPEREIYSRLAFNKHHTIISSTERNRITNYILEAYELCKLRGCYRILEIIQKTDDKIFFENNIILESSAIAKLLKDSTAAVFMSATAGEQIAEKIIELSNTIGAMEQAVIFDATASEVTDAALDYIQNLLKFNERKNNRIISNRRFSPGYGDFKIQNQQLFFYILELEKLGLTLLDSYLIKPEKSVTAIAAI